MIILYLLIAVLGLFVVGAIFGVWFARHNRAKISKDLEGVHIHITRSNKAVSDLIGTVYSTVCDLRDKK